jgi:(p)ppGpp synthase/HD superfamily hydrolase
VTTRAAPPQLTDRFLAAVALANEVHGDARRIGTNVPYMAHLLVVTGLVLEDGGDEDQVIAALLHDAVEDGGGRALLQRIEAEFGSRVARIVEACSDTLDVGERRPWPARKERYLAHLATITDPGILRVTLADKVNNARSIVRDYQAEGDVMWARFTNKTARDQLWYFERLLPIFSAHCDGPLVTDLREAVDDLERLMAAHPRGPRRRRNACTGMTALSH